MADDLILKVGGKTVRGWTDFRVSRGIERFPSSFDIGLTEVYPGASQTTVLPGNSCQVMLGNDLLVSGYVDRYRPGFNKVSHRVRVTGRGKCQDLVDCSAEWPNSQISNVTILQLAEALAKPYDITVTDLAGINTVLPTYNIAWGETPYDILERACRYLRLLMYEGADGNLILAQVGTAQAASGVEEGKNVEDADIEYSIDQRFSDYVARLMSISSLDDLGSGGDILATVKDPGVNRHRLRYMVVESGQAPIITGETLGEARAKWECSRRFGRSAMLHVTVDSWRDEAGKLWTPNTLVPVNLPTLKATNKQWILSNVTYRRSEAGDFADLLLMPPQAFAPQPDLLLPWMPELQTNAAGTR